VRNAFVVAAPVSTLAVPVTGCAKMFSTQVPTPPATSGSGPPKMNTQVPTPEHWLLGHWLSTVHATSSFGPPMQCEVVHGVLVVHWIDESLLQR
jgi:hypothetical protein